MPARAAPPEDAVDQAVSWIELLASEIGPRRPTSDAERRAAQRMQAELRSSGLEARLEAFRGYSSFAWPLGLIALSGVLPALLPRRRRLLKAALAGTSVAGVLTEGGVVRSRYSLSSLLSRRPSQNLVAMVEPSGDVKRTLCLVGHLDSSRSGLMFHPSVSGHVNPGFTVQSAACLVQGAEPMLARRRAGRTVLGLARALLLAGLTLLAERELRGRDVPGANDNASGTAVAARLALECLARRPGSTRVVLLLTGCEESGLLGAKAFLRSRDTRGWLFLNFDSVGGPATLRYARREGIGGMLWDADTALLELAAKLAASRPDLGLESAPRPIGLTYDTTPVLASGGRAITFVAGNGGIPNYHWPSDTAENVDRSSVARALEVGREMIAAIDGGEVDRPSGAGGS